LVVVVVEVTIAPAHLLAVVGWEVVVLVQVEEAPLSQVFLIPEAEAEAVVVSTERPVTVVLELSSSDISCRYVITK
jgi:hypothetical protein